MRKLQVRTWSPGFEFLTVKLFTCTADVNGFLQVGNSLAKMDDEVTMEANWSTPVIGHLQASGGDLPRTKEGSTPHPATISLSSPSHPHRRPVTCLTF